MTNQGRGGRSSGDRPVAVLAALGANLAIAVAKAVAFAVTGSASMLAESVHSVADSANEALLLVGRRRAQVGPDAAHPFGYGHESYFWTFLVAILLFAVGSVVSIIEGARRLGSGHEVESPAWAIGVLLVSMVFEGLSLRTAVRRTNRERTGSWWGYVHDTRAPEKAVVLLEDSAAEIGLVAALTGVGLAWWTGDGRFDALGALVVGALLGVVAFVLARELRSLIVGEAASDTDLARLQQVLADDPDVDRVVEVRTMHLGPEEVLVAARLVLVDRSAGPDPGEHLDALAEAMRAAVPVARRIYLTPTAARRSR